jgi:glycosyltransferase involved in cell wall biosynthesis
VAEVDVLLPTCNRRESLIMTLAGLATQSLADFGLIVADQSDEPANVSVVVRSLCGVIEARGGRVRWHHRPQLHGIAEQRDFLLRESSADAVLYIDDDIFIEPWVLARLLTTLRDEGCGFVGAFGAGTSYLNDERPEQQIVERWDGPVLPEVVEPEGHGWERWNLHRAANTYHAGRRVPAGEVWRYKVAWVAACILYDRQKLLDVGGFSFWEQLPRFHSGEEVLVQNLLMRRFGGCCILPSGAWFSESPSTVLNERGAVDGHALDLLEEMVDLYAPDPRSG